MQSQFKGPPDECWHCGSKLRRESKSASSGIGCIVVILGLLLAPVLIGIPIILYGLHLMMKREGIWRCKRCEATFPRRIRWYELG